MSSRKPTRKKSAKKKTSAPVTVETTQEVQKKNPLADFYVQSLTDEEAELFHNLPYDDLEFEIAMTRIRLRRAYEQERVELGVNPKKKLGTRVTVAAASRNWGIEISGLVVQLTKLINLQAMLKGILKKGINVHIDYGDDPVNMEAKEEEEE